jgi:DNA-binding transcriptional MerR regulator
MNERSEFTTSDVAKIAGLSTRQVHYWDKIDFIKPSGIEKRGKISQRVYNFRDLVAFRAARRLLQAGLPLQRVRYAIGRLQEQMGIKAKDILCETVFVTDGKKLFELVREPPRLKEILSGQIAFIYAVGMKDLIGRLDTDIRMLEDERGKFSRTINDRQIDLVNS